MKKIWILFFFSFLIIACKNNSYEVSKINAKQLKIGNEVNKTVQSFNYLLLIRKK